MVLPKVSVDVVTYNRRDSLKRCLDALMDQTFDDFETLVVDGGSTDRTLELVEKYPVRCQTESGGLVRAYNRGWREAKGEIVAIIDDDTVPSKNWMEEIMKTYGARPDAGAVGGPQIISRSRYTEGSCALGDALTPMPMAYEGVKGFLVDVFNAIVMGKEGFKEGKVYKSGYTSHFTVKGKEPIEVDYVNINMTFKKEALIEVDGFDERYNIGHEDRGLLMRVYNGTEPAGEPAVEMVKLDPSWYLDLWPPCPIVGTPERGTHLLERYVDFWCITYDGSLYVPTAGEYAFSVRSDDESSLYIDDEIVVEGGPTERTANLWLEEGHHKIHIVWTQWTHVAYFELAWRPPGSGSCEPIPTEYLYLT